MAGCTLCPRRCGADRENGERGFCGASSVLRIGRASLHRWEEPCLSGTGGAGTVFFCHCTLRCVYCQNAVISGRDGGHSGVCTDPSGLAETFLSLQAQGAHTIDLVTPTHYLPQIIRAIELAKQRGLTIPFVYNTGGYERVEILRKLEGLIDIYLPDLKYYSSYYSQRYSSAADYYDVAVDAIAEMVRQTGAPAFDAKGMLTKGTIIRHLMLPGLGSDTAQVLRAIASRWREEVLVSLMRQYTPLPHLRAYPELNRPLTEEEYAAGCSLMQELGLAGFVQDAESISESFIPVFDGSGVPVEFLKAIPHPSARGMSPEKS